MMNRDENAVASAPREKFSSQAAPEVLAMHSVPMQRYGGAGNQSLPLSANACCPTSGVGSADTKQRSPISMAPSKVAICYW
jgi:hypothetical protein